VPFTVHPPDAYRELWLRIRLRSVLAIKINPKMTLRKMSICLHSQTQIWMWSGELLRDWTWGVAQCSKQRCWCGAFVKQSPCPTMPYVVH